MSETRRGGAGLLLAAFLLCLIVRLSTLGHLALWLDEVTTADVIGMSWPELVANRLANGHFPTYFVLLKILGLAGGSEFALRLPSAVFDSLAGALVARLALRLDGWIGAILATLLYALMPNLIQYGQEARPYALLLLFVAIAMTAQIALLRPATNPRRAAVVATVGTLGAAFAIPAGIVTVATQHLALLFLPLRYLPATTRRAWGAHVAITWAAILIGIAVLIPAVRQQATSPTGLMKWQATYPFSQRAIETFGETYGFVVRHDADRFWPEAGNGWLAAGLLGLMAVGLIANRRKPTHRMLAVTAIGTPILHALLGLVSASAGRYLIGMLPAAILLAASGARVLLQSRQTRVPAAILLLVFGVGLSLQALDTLVSERKYDWRPIAAFLDHEDLGPLEILTDTPQSGPDIDHYLHHPDSVTFSTINPTQDPLEILWARARNRPMAWLLLPAGEMPPDDISAGASVCRWSFGEMALTLITRDPSRMPPALRGPACAEAKDN